MPSYVKFLITGIVTMIAGIVCLPLEVYINGFLNTPLSFTLLGSGITIIFFTWAVWLIRFLTKNKFW